MTRFWHYRQNNSYGHFDSFPDRGIGINVIIEAGSTKEADARAEQIGLYFDGCDAGIDCDCCGDRWTAAYSDGDAVPSMWGTPVHADESNKQNFVHYLDGRIVSVTD